MNVKENPNLIQSFNFEGVKQPVSFVETMHVTDGVDCDVYTFDEDPTKDLGIIRISPGMKTPLQKVLKGDRTIEGYVSGKGRFKLTKSDGNQEVYEVGKEASEQFPITVKIGELMQWEADKNTALTAYEVCFPPYEDGRYENIE